MKLTRTQNAFAAARTRIKDQFESKSLVRQAQRRMSGSALREPSIHSSEPPPMHCDSSSLMNAKTSSVTPDTA